MANRMCTYSGCKAIATHSGRCDKHKREARQRKEYEHNRMGRLANIYNSAKWKKLRAAKIAANPICELCESVGDVVPATEIDHQLEIIDFRNMAFDMANLMSLCAQCHRQKTALYRQLRKTNKKKLIWSLDAMRPLSDSQRRYAQEVFDC